MQTAGGGYTLDDNRAMILRWPSRIAAFALWSLAALSATAWALKIAGLSEAPVTAAAIARDAPAVDVRDLARALGPEAPQAAPVLAAAAQAPQAQDPAARLRLLGVVAGRRSAGVALISVDGQLPRPYRVGSVIDTGYRLTRVAPRSATLAPPLADGQAITLELPPTDAAAAPAAAGIAVPGRPSELARGNPPFPAAAPVSGAAPAANAVPADNNDEARKD